MDDEAQLRMALIVITGIVLVALIIIGGLLLVTRGVAQQLQRQETVRLAAGVRGCESLPPGRRTACISALAAQPVQLAALTICNDMSTRTTAELQLCVAEVLGRSAASAIQRATVCDKISGTSQALARCIAASTRATSTGRHTRGAGHG